MRRKITSSRRGPSELLCGGNALGQSAFALMHPAASRSREIEPAPATGRNLSAHSAAKTGDKRGERGADLFG